MTTSLTRSLAAATFILFAAVACAGSPPQWTFAPAATSGELDAEESLPVASQDPALPDAAPPEASPALESAPPGDGSPPASAAPAASPGPAGSAPPAGEARVIAIQATQSLQFTTPDGQRITDIPVTPGETVTFAVDNVAGFDHDFYIGTDAQLNVPNASGMPGIPTWTSGVQEYTWTVPDDITDLKFGCTIPGHYTAGMQGTFSAAS
jgi:hypothetical protein